MVVYLFESSMYVSIYEFLYLLSNGLRASLRIREVSVADLDAGA